MPPVCRNQGHSHLSLSARLGVNEALARYDVFLADLRSTVFLPFDLYRSQRLMSDLCKKSTCELENRPDDLIQLLLCYMHELQIGILAMTFTVND